MTLRSYGVVGRHEVGSRSLILGCRGASDQEHPHIGLLHVGEKKDLLL